MHLERQGEAPIAQAPDLEGGVDLDLPGAIELHTADQCLALGQHVEQQADLVIGEHGARMAFADSAAHLVEFYVLDHRVPFS